jgi:hypothetical protein
MATVETATEIRPFRYHFAAWEEPGLFSEELRAAFESVR